MTDAICTGAIDHDRPEAGLQHDGDTCPIHEDKTLINHPMLRKVVEGIIANQAAADRIRALERNYRELAENEDRGLFTGYRRTYDRAFSNALTTALVILQEEGVI